MRLVRTVSVLTLTLALAAAPQRAKAAGWGTIKGQVTYGGAAIPANPLAKNVPAAEKAICCAKGGPHTDEWVINPNNKGVRYVLVWLAPSARNTDNVPKTLPINPALRAIPKKPVVLDQPLCEYIPHVLAVRQGQDVLAKNSAPIPHSVKWEGPKNPGNNVLLSPGKSRRIRHLVPQNTPVVVQCSIHLWMRAYIGVFNHPYFAVTDKDGNFEIQGAPAGKWRLVGWQDSTGWVSPDHTRAGTPVTVKAGATTVVNLVVLPAGGRPGD